MKNETARREIESLDYYLQNHTDDYSEESHTAMMMAIKALEQDPKLGHCKDCKWWRDSDGVYRRGVGADSRCPINLKEVYEGNGYCFMFEPRESEG